MCVGSDSLISATRTDSSDGSVSPTAALGVVAETTLSILGLKPG